VTVIPKIDERDRAEILEELKVLASQYVPELKDGNNVGFAVLQVFAYMVDEVITRLNKVPKKNFVAFLKMFETEPTPAQPARIPKQFDSNEEMLENVLFPAETQVETSANEDEQARFIDKVTNIDAVQSAIDTEKAEDIFEKTSKRLQHNGRAVTTEDYEWLAKEASRDVARAKCLPNLNDSGEEESGCVSVIIVPKGREDKPRASPELLRIVERYLKSRSPASISSLTVTSPTYLEISVTADLYVTSNDSASNIKLKAIEKLKDFLHPLYGGNKCRGWDFGRIPCNFDVLALLQKIPEVDHVENLSITVKEEKKRTSFVVKNDTNLPTYTMISSGKHQIEVRCVGAR